MGVEAETIRAQVGRLVRSKAFETSEVHRHLLQYLAEKTLAGESDRLKEYVIGLEAFGKPPSYDPKRDSIVRLQIGRLRQKLSAYYETEAAGDSIRISVPKGSFGLEFEPLAPDAAPPSPGWFARRRMPLLCVVLAATTLWAVIATLGAWRYYRQSAAVSRRWTPELEAIWAPFLESNRPVLLCLGTPLFIRFPSYGFFRDPKTNDWQEIDKSDRIAAERKALGDKDILPAFTFTGVGEASAAVLVSNLLATRLRDLQLTRSSILSWQQTVDDDVVFLGPPKFNFQLQTASMEQDIVVEPEGIRNLKPQPGEPAFLPDHIVAGKQSEGETHALISLIPGLSGVGRLMVIAGNASADTFAAAEWLTEPWHAAELVRRLRGPNGRLPRYYEVILKVAFRQGIPVQSSYVLHHVLPDPATPGGKR